MAEAKAKTATPEDVWADVQTSECPNCKVGVRYIIRWDVDALHESGDNAQIVGDRASGGAYETVCFVCTTRESHPLVSPTEDAEA